MPLSRWLYQARSELFDLARRYTSSYLPGDGGELPDGERTLVAMTGHQPRLFHPGVWFKNFALSRLAQAVNGVAIHLIVDNDATGGSAVRVPVGSPDQPRMESIAYDRSGEATPFEDRAILDGAMFRSFGRRVAECLEPLIPEPLIREFWPGAVEAARRTERLGLAIAQARHQLEASWGLRTWELPLSHVCETESFRRFLACLWHDLSRFVEVHNELLGEYRRVHRIRSRSHPVPPLARTGDWLETPCWIWSGDDPVRRPLFVRPSAAGWELTDRGAQSYRLKRSSAGSLDSLIGDLADLAARGVRIRPRALLTTMYTRLVLCDLFVHGIGGGKYDQLTDAIIERFWGMAPPRFVVLSATLELPIPRPEETEDDLRRRQSVLRDLEFNPDRLAPITDETRPWIEAKRRWIATRLPRGQRGARHRGIQQANAALRPAVASHRERLEYEVAELRARLHEARGWSSREFAFCLFPARTLQALLLDKR
jgi:hypothetical protein